MKEAILLAGGLGTRLKTVVSDLPKPMAPVAGKPFLEYLLNYWAEQGVERFVLSVSHLHHKIAEHFGSEWKGREIAYSVEESPLGTGGAIAQALLSVEGRSAFIGNGDTYVEVDLQSMQEFHRMHSSDLTLAATRVDSTERYSPLQVDNTGKLTGFETVGQAGPGQINAGVFLIDKTLLKKVPPPGQKFSWEADYLPLVLKSQAKSFVFTAGPRFLDIGIPEDYARAAAFLR